MDVKSFVLQSLHMMCCWAEDPNGDEFKYHLARVPDYLWLAEDGMKMQVCFLLRQSEFWFCHSFHLEIVAYNEKFDVPLEAKLSIDSVFSFQSFGSQIWDCALATQAIMASNMADEYGDSLKKAHFYIKESQVISYPLICMHEYIQTTKTHTIMCMVKI